MCVCVCVCERERERERERESFVIFSLLVKSFLLQWFFLELVQPKRSLEEKNMSRQPLFHNYAVALYSLREEVYMLSRQIYAEDSVAKKKNLVY